MSEAFPERGLALHMPATPARAPIPVLLLMPTTAARATRRRCADALRKKRGTESPTEIVEAQDSLERRIRAHLAKGRVAVTLTDNRYTMISVRRLAKESATRSASTTCSRTPTR